MIINYKLFCFRFAITLCETQLSAEDCSLFLAIEPAPEEIYNTASTTIISKDTLPTQIIKEPEEESGGSSTDAGLIAGIVVAVVFVLILSVLVIILLLR